ncbi:hypothetical protein [Streptomyces sp. AC627_RSS907]|uniref:hypothetical protein n=1 Tax=Streptomyces sp. AC627_RSS907 TaxID=2823684 RepID=UPI001C21CECB|nr:hypothetical protein [Streptomyces sp. AC627_RSS907]
MNDNRAAIAAAMAGGYLLGRTKKAKLAFAVASYLAGRRIGPAPGQVLSQGLGRLQLAPQFQELSDQVRGELLTAGRTAVTAAANRGLTGLADNLRARTDALTGAGRGGGGAAEDGDGDHGQYDDGAPDEDAYADTDADTYDEDAYFDDEDREEDREPAPAPPRRADENARPRKAAPAGKAAAARSTTGSGGRRGGGRG